MRYAGNHYFLKALLKHVDMKVSVCGYMHTSTVSVLGPPELEEL